MSSAQAAKLRALLERYISGGIDTTDFCSAFERGYNFDVDKMALTPSEAQAFAELFDEVVFYSPYPDERAKIPNYRSELEIEEAAKRAAAKVGV